MFRHLPPCNDVGADASALFSSGRGDLAPTIFGEGIVISKEIKIIIDRETEFPPTKNCQQSVR